LLPALYGKRIRFSRWDSSRKKMELTSQSEAVKQGRHSRGLVTHHALMVYRMNYSLVRGHYFGSGAWPSQDVWRLIWLNALSAQAILDFLYEPKSENILRNS